MRVVCVTRALAATRVSRSPACRRRSRCARRPARSAQHDSNHGPNAYSSPGTACTAVGLDVLVDIHGAYKVAATTSHDFAARGFCRSCVKAHTYSSPGHNVFIPVPNHDSTHMHVGLKTCLFIISLQFAHRLKVVKLLVSKPSHSAQT